MRRPSRRVTCSLLAGLALLGVYLLAQASDGPRGVPTPRDPTRPALTVLTYNVNFAIAGDPATVEAIRRSGADVVFLQESNAEWEAALRPALGATYPHMVFKSCCTAGGQAVLSRFPFVSLGELEGLYFPAWRLRVESPLGPIQVLNVHLRPPLSGSGPLMGYYSNRSFRQSEIAHFAGTLDPELPTLVVGDFNEHESLAVHWLEDRGYTDALPLFATSQITWHWKIRGHELRDTLDHVLTSGGLHAVAGAVEELGNSDHFPVRVVLQR